MALVSRLATEADRAYVRGLRDPLVGDEALSRLVLAVLDEAEAAVDAATVEVR